MPPSPDSGLVYDRIESNQRRSAVVVALLGIATLLFVGYLAMWLTALVVWLTTQGDSPAGHEVFTAKLLSAALAALAAVPVLSYLGFSSSPRLLLRMVRARPIGPTDEPDLHRVVENLSIAAGLPAPRLYVIEAASPNAFAAGLDPERASLVVTSGLLRLLDRSELEGVIAHEFSHIGNHDTRLNMTTAALVMTLRLPVAALQWVWRAARRGAASSVDQGLAMMGMLVRIVMGAPAVVTFAIFLPAMFWRDFGYLSPVMLLLPVHVFILAPLLAPQVSRAVSREREYLADADAVLLTRNPEALVRALAKISAVYRPAYVHPAIAHLYFTDPSSLGRSRTHPPIQDRIARLAEIARIPLPVVSLAPVSESAEAVEEATPASMPWASFGDSVVTRVIRLDAPAPLLQSPSPDAPVRLQLPESTLLITFEEQGEYLQAVTADRVFGYLQEGVPRSQVDMDPADVQAHLPPPSPQEAAQNKLSESQTVAIIVLLALVFFVVLVWVLLDFIPR